MIKLKDIPIIILILLYAIVLPLNVYGSYQDELLITSLKTEISHKQSEIDSLNAKVDHYSNEVNLLANIINNQNSKNYLELDKKLQLILSEILITEKN